MLSKVDNDLNCIRTGYETCIYACDSKITVQSSEDHAAGETKKNK